jgi:hypothetical protein
MKTEWWESRNKAPNYSAWLDDWHSSIICACDHGCNQWLAENAGKAHELLLAMQKGATEMELDAIVQKHVSEVNIAIVTRMFDEAKARRKSTDETKG